MQAYVLPSLFALFVWWFSTGAIIFLDNLPRKTFKYSVIGASFVLLGSLIGLQHTAHQSTMMAAYGAYFFGLFAWGWQEITFYMGYVTGPRKEVCPEGCSGWGHFVHAIQTSLWHELAIIVTAIVVVAITWHQPNQIGMWTFMVLWWMHQSAKLNVFFGVRNLNEQFLPEHLNFLKGFLTSKPMNLFFPFSITISMVIATLMWEGAAHAPTQFVRAGDTFLAVMMSLAILEHWFLVIPLPAGNLWSWGLASRKVTKAFSVEIAAGFLGAGKTTYMRRRLADLADEDRATASKTVVLVNDFAAVGIDGSMLGDQGADVVELPNGCICCSLRDDLATQLKTVVARYAPNRVLIEPSGVADIAALIGVLRRPELAPHVADMVITTVIDAGAFLADYAALPAHFAAQARLASTLIINKADTVSPATLEAVAETLRRLNPAVAIFAARYGQTAATPMTVLALVPHNHDAHSHDAHSHDAHSHDAHSHDAHSHDAHCHDDHCTHAGHDHGQDESHAHHEAHEHVHAADALGYTSWSTNLTAPVDAQALSALLDQIARGRFGQVKRVKGIARAAAGWLAFDLAGGRPSISAFAAAAGEVARCVAIGAGLDEPGLEHAFAGCALSKAT
jgi:putative photosynthetic complex assembly protein 2